ncbi:MAG: hypothetical protein AVDCRST_MAG83-3007, partial [uncultured Arthrobacter sp.]
WPESMRSTCCRWNGRRREDAWRRALTARAAARAVHGG